MCLRSLTILNYELPTAAKIQADSLCYGTFDGAFDVSFLLCGQ